MPKNQLQCIKKHGEREREREGEREVFAMQLSNMEVKNTNSLYHFLCSTFYHNLIGYIFYLRNNKNK